MENKILDIVLSENKKDPIIQIYDLTDRATKSSLHNFSVCGFCLHDHNYRHIIDILYPIVTLENLAILCTPNDRYNFGKFWQKKYCSYPGIHKHYKCEKCSTQWIVRIVNNYSAITVFE